MKRLEGGEKMDIGKCVWPFHKYEGRWVGVIKFSKVDGITSSNLINPIHHQKKT